ncbi:hypothetical protein [Catenovulum sediminis]|uniref:Uncharacterized protein n=1 Tax=Catenovulum sediminis TaxID=1740262 RepID=A0ABV1RM38_9ALTE
MSSKPEIGPVLSNLSNSRRTASRIKLDALPQIITSRDNDSARQWHMHDAAEQNKQCNGQMDMYVRMYDDLKREKQQIAQLEQEQTKGE